MRILANSVQKSGTHLLLRLLAQLGYPRYREWRLDPEWTEERSAWRRIRMHPPGTRVVVPLGNGVDVSERWVSRLLTGMPDDHVLLGHCGFSPELSTVITAASVRKLAIVRDPRDVVVSHAYFLMKIGKSKITRKPEHQALVALPDHASRMRAMIRGAPGTPSVGDRYRAFLGWRDHPGILIVKFEDLVGASGGEDADRQLATIRQVAEHLGIEVDEDRITEIQSELFGGTDTFRRGTTGQWREEFSDEHVAAAREELADMLVELGYEDGADW